MNTKEMDKLITHFNTYFEQGDPVILHPITMNPHIDILKYEPTEKYHFWKLVTMGASDHRMNGKNDLGNRNEYMMFVDADENFDDQDTLNWYRAQLMMGAFLEFPQIIEDPGILRCKLGLLKTAVCLQVTLLNESEMERLRAIGPQQFSEYLYPETGGTWHYLSQRKRDDKF